MHFGIDTTWDGKAVHAEERVVLDLTRETCESGAGADWIFELDAPFHGDPPPPVPAGPTRGLWNHEVVELFLLAPPDHYLEIELGPHGHHQALELRGVRRPVREGLPLDFRATIDRSRWRGRARIPQALVPDGVARLNAFAIHGLGEHRRHLAFRPVPGPEPDFHRLEHFADLAPELLQPERGNRANPANGS